MNKKCFAYTAVPCLLFVLTGCAKAGEKSANLSVVYGVAVLLALLALVVFCFSPIRKEKWLGVLFTSVLVVNTGYFWLSASQNLSTALMANRLSYLGSVFLPLSVLMVILKVTNAKYPKWLASALISVAALVFVLAASPGYSKLYYSDVKFVRADGVSFLQKEYGPLHSLYFVYLLVYFAAMVTAVIYPIVKKKISVTYHAVILALAVFVNLGVWLIEQFVNVGFEMLSVSYVISEMFLLSLYVLVSETEKLKALAADNQPPVPVAPVSGQVLRPVDEDQIEAFTMGIKVLTPTEKHIFDLYILRKTTKEIMAELNIKENTLKFHNKNIYGKLGVSSRKQLLEIYGRVKNTE